ncbi:hypothetical protein AVEN_98196-1 [Araneus ventricosus]|uniref:Uncharacterized protein n=1 Tax=Araneus ventricosus TaxID=182803 RepID=A0A4Y2HK06_ARAVE|nr:hypothetical protein AVEN_98196-1 [Araneus ventricosus]
MTSSQVGSLFSRMSALHEGGTLKPPSPGLEHVDDINEDLDDIEQDDITEQDTLIYNFISDMSYVYITFPSLQELEQLEVQNLLTTLELIHDVQLQLAGYEQEKDGKGKKRSLTICPITPKRIKKYI